MNNFTENKTNEIMENETKELVEIRYSKSYTTTIEMSEKCFRKLSEKCDYNDGYFSYFQPTDRDWIEILLSLGMRQEEDFNDVDTDDSDYMEIDEIISDFPIRMDVGTKSIH